MKWSWRLGRVAGIDIKMHWTFLLLLVWVATSFLMRGDDIVTAARGVAIVAAFFVCIVLHELGHALTAKRYNVATRDITLLPIGGLARLDRIPREPWQEFWIAVAGPAVNVAIAAAVAVYLAATGAELAQSSAPPSFADAPFLPLLFAFNVVVVVFNLLPAFPMDGGRVLRALLATRMSYVRATTLAANTGQLMAIAFGVVGLFYNPLLLLIAFFVYLGAEAESQFVHFRAAIDNVPVREAMMTRFRALSPDDTLGDSARELLAGSQQDFPVVDHGELVGMLLRTDLAEKLASDGEATAVRDAMRSDVARADVDEMLETAVVRMSERHGAALPVLRNQTVVGLLTTENIGELIMVKAALRKDALPANHPERLVPTPN